GIVIETRARFGYTAAPGTTDDGRLRLITQSLPPAYAARLFDAQAAGATEQQLRDIAAEGLQEIYFKDRGRRALDLQVEFTDRARLPEATQARIYDAHMHTRESPHNIRTSVASVADWLFVPP
ncbi:telomere-protecting terminal protein Tpg, partial [Streptomyces lunaelactis]